MQNDNELIKQVQLGDTRKLGILYEKYKKDLFHYFYRMTNDGPKSEDLVQNTFMKVMKYSQNFSGEGKFNYWLFSIARNLWIDSLKKKDVLKQAAGVESLYGHHRHSDAADLSLAKKERKDMLHFALSKISEEKREAIFLSRFQELKYSEIATLCNCTENAIKSRVKRGLEEVKEIIEKLELN